MVGKHIRCQLVILAEHHDRNKLIAMQIDNIDNRCHEENTGLGLKPFILNQNCTVCYLLIAVYLLVSSNRIVWARVMADVVLPFPHLRLCLCINCTIGHRN